MSSVRLVAQSQRLRNQARRTRRHAQSTRLDSRALFDRRRAVLAKTPLPVKQRFYQLAVRHIRSTLGRCEARLLSTARALYWSTAQPLVEDQLVLTYNSLLALKIRVADGVSFFQRERGLWSDANPGVEADAAEVILRSERVTAGCEQVLASLWALIQQLGPSYRDALNC